MLRPEIPSCAECQAHVFGENWKRTARPIPRPPNLPPPCYKCPKSDDGRPAPHNELGERNRKAIELYWQVRAGAPMPDDPIVRRNCGLIEGTLAWVEANRPIVVNIPDRNPQGRK